MQETQGASRFVDLFAGSASVSWFVAEKNTIPVVAVDLQKFATVMAKAVLCRTSPIDTKTMFELWQSRAVKHMRAGHATFLKEAQDIKLLDWKSSPVKTAELSQQLCVSTESLPIVKAYGGYYFSPIQALYIDALRLTLPRKREQKWIALASLIQAASRSAAAPGHTAQPFKPTETGAASLFAAWNKDIFSQTQKALKDVGSKFALAPGKAHVRDAVQFARSLTDQDLIFIDPPYSSEHYSRFYHVLETLARGNCSDVKGQGRYPPPKERPMSDFSIKSKSQAAFKQLFSILAKKGVRAILTYPLEDTSNGMSGTAVKELAAEYFSVSRTLVKGRFSTLGGNGNHRSAKVESAELILILRPK